MSFIKQEEKGPLKRVYHAKANKKKFIEKERKRKEKLLREEAVAGEKIKKKAGRRAKTEQVTKLLVYILGRLYKNTGTSQPAFNCSKLATETLEQSVEYVQD